MNKKTSPVKTTKTSTVKNAKTTKTPITICQPKKATSRKPRQTKNAKLTTAQISRKASATTSQKTERAAKNRRTIVDVCIGIFTKNENKPMYVKNIYGAMRQRHWRTEGKTPQQTISSKLNADYRFIRVSPNTFQMDNTFYNNRIGKNK